MKKFLFLATILSLGATGDAFAQRKRDGIAPVKSTPQLLSTFKPVNERASKSTVRVFLDGKEAALGTIVATDGYILSKASELKEGKISVKLKDGKTLDAILTSVNDVFDLAMLKIDASELTPVEWTASKNAQVGNWVAATSPASEPVAVGVVSVATRELPPPYGRTNVPTEKSGFLGVSLNFDSASAMIDRVEPGSAAEKAGLMPKDIILMVDGYEIINSEALINTLVGMKAGDVITVKFEREGSRKELKVTLGARPKELIPKGGKNRGDMQNSMGSTLSERRTGFPSILQHDLVLKPFDCGGPLVDLDGRVVGINIARAGRVESYAIPSEVIMSVIPAMIAAKPVSNPTEAVAEASAFVKRLETQKAAIDKAILDAKKKLEVARSEEKWWKDHPKEKGPEPRVVAK